MHLKSLKINKNSSENSLGKPLGMKNVIWANLQYLPRKKHIFQDSRDQKINKQIINLSKNQSADLSNRKDPLFIKKRPRNYQKYSQNDPKMIPNDTQMSPKWPPNDPGETQGAQKWPQVIPKWPQRTPKHPKGPTTSPKWFKHETKVTLDQLSKDPNLR